MCQAAELAKNYHFNINAATTFADYYAEKSFARLPLHHGTNRSSLNPYRYAFVAAKVGFL
ncbi:MAG: hypothetical protein KDC04_08995 [Saprospiraceae bacterium]|nr:hypothetical protein [Saprospiraceae bacterium]